MSIQRVHHVQITIPTTDTDQARHFYCDVLGLIEIPKQKSLQQHGGFWVQLENIDVPISLEDGIKCHATKVHMAYQVDDSDAMRQKIIAESLIIKDAVPIPGYDRFACHDPFSNRIEFIRPHD